MDEKKLVFLTKIVREDKHAYSDQSSDRRYVPHSGGTMGWLDQQEIPKSEQKNGYGYASDIPADEFRAMVAYRKTMHQNPQAQKSSTTSKKHRITGQPVDLSRATITLHWGEHAAKSTQTGMTMRAVKLSFDSFIPLQKGDKVLIHLVDEGQSKEDPLQVATEVAWVEEATEPPLSWNVGLAYSEINPNSHLKKLQVLLEGSVDEDEVLPTTAAKSLPENIGLPPAKTNA